MKNKTKNIVSWSVTIFAALCGVAAFFTIFAEAVAFEGLIFGESFSGLQVALGYSVNDIVIFKASAGIILAYLLPLLGACALIIGKGNKIVSLLGTAAMLTGGILALCTVQLLQGGFIGVPSLAAGAISSGVLAIVGGVSACASAFLKA